MTKKNKILIGAGILAVGVLAAGCGNSGDAKTSGETPAATSTGSGEQVAGTVNIDGSTTVYPIVEAMAAEFKGINPDATLNVNKAGTGSGFQKFVRGEIDIATASRPIEAEEMEAAKKANLDFIEIPIAYDGLCVVVNTGNTVVEDLTVEELKKAWEPNSKVTTWADIRAGLPAEKIVFFGPTTNHGTFEYFTEAIVGKKKAQRTDYQPNQEYNALVQGVANEKNSLGYVGYSYYEQNKDKVKVVKVGGVAPTADTILDGTYTPLSRPLFLYVSKKAYDANPAVKSFVGYALGDGKKWVSDPQVGYVQLPAEAYEAISKNVSAGTTGSKFQGITPGMKVTDILAKESN